MILGFEVLPQLLTAFRVPHRTLLGADTAGMTIKSWPKRWREMEDYPGSQPAPLVGYDYVMAFVPAHVDNPGRAKKIGSVFVGLYQYLGERRPGRHQGAAERQPDHARARALETRASRPCCDDMAGRLHIWWGGNFIKWGQSGALNKPLVRFDPGSL